MTKATRKTNYNAVAKTSYASNKTTTKKLATIADWDIGFKPSKAFVAASESKRNK